jgi:two-component sensor histidine kinase
LSTPEAFDDGMKLVIAEIPSYQSIRLVTDPANEPPEVAEIYQRAVEYQGKEFHESMIVVSNSPEILIGVPVVRMTPRRAVLGVVVGRLRLEQVLQLIMDTAQQERFEIILLGAKEQFLYRTGVAATGWDVQILPLEVLDEQWQLRIGPSAAFIASNTSRSPLLILWGGLGLSVLISLAVGQWSLQRRRHEMETRSHIEALERLSELSAAISAKLGSGNEVIDRLPRAACELLGMDTSIVGIADADRKLIHVVATVGVNSVGKGDYFLEAAPGVRHSLQTGQIVIIEDSEKVKELVNPDEMRRLGVRSAMELPLRIESRVIGMLIVGDRRPQVLDESKVQLARLLANQAAVILANHRLYQQMDEAIAVQRRDADARAVLLRELNHRVKNNLAGIVALLSVGEPEMPENARQWLGRVTDRISNMARTHELLSGGMQTVDLKELVENMLPSLAVIRPPGVRIVSEMESVDVVLGTERAVGLAMVLHELCYNAIVYGSGENGCVTIRARAAKDQRVVVEVMDQGLDGRQKSVEGESARRDGGMGLTLVRGLVSRELQGEFTLCSRAEGGTVATVSFPLRHDETTDVSI